MDDLKIILNIFYEPVDKLKKIVEENKDVLVPINGGSKLKDNDWVKTYCYFDDEGLDNISHLNPILNEFSSIYWIWKNYDKIGNPNYIGFSHYRRYLSKEEIQDYKDYDLIFAKGKRYKYNIYDAYKKLHIETDLYLLFKILNELESNIFNYKEFSKSFYTYLNTCKIFFGPCNLFIMKKENFFVFCEFIFPILFKLVEEINLNDGRDNYQKRAICFLAERIFSFICFLNFMDKNKKCKAVNIKEFLDFKNNKLNERGTY